MSEWFTYLLRCADDALYCGVTNNVERRVAQHNSGKGAKYTRLFRKRPVELAMILRYDTKRDAYSAEYYVKQMSRAEKLDLISMDEAGAKMKIEEKKIKK